MILKGCLERFGGEQTGETLFKGDGRAPAEEAMHRGQIAPEMTAVGVAEPERVDGDGKIAIGDPRQGVDDVGGGPFSGAGGVSQAGRGGG